MAKLIFTTLQGSRNLREIMILCIIFFIVFVPLCVGRENYFHDKEEMNLVQKRDAGYWNPGDIPLLNGKVVRGIRETVFEHPYLVSIRRKIVHYLTGTLISPHLALTVARPLAGVPTDELGLVGGESYSDRGTMIMAVIAVIMPEEFNKYSIKANLALVLFYEKMPPRSSMHVITLVKEDFIFANRSLTGFVSGWGRCETVDEDLCLPRSTKYYPNEPQDPMLKTVSFEVKSSKFCDTYEEFDLRLEKDMLCLGVARQEQHSCPCLAVPGAPLVVDGKLLAVLSWGFGCGFPFDMALIYTDIRQYYKWITHNSNELLHIDVEEISLLYEATKASTVLHWLEKTIYYPINEYLKKNQHVLNELNSWKIDFYFARCIGVVWDIRDFVANGTYSADKTQMFKKIKQLLVMNGTGLEATSNLELTESIYSEAEIDAADLSDEYFVSTAKTSSNQLSFLRVINRTQRDQSTNWF